MKSIIRNNINSMEGYIPGEQPKVPGLIKLNTNENPYPPSPAIIAIINSLLGDTMRLYPDPMADQLRNTISELYHFRSDNIVVGNGSDDIICMVIKTFVNEKDSIICFNPTYSLYPVLAQIQDAKTIHIELDENFNIPERFLKSELKKLALRNDLKVFFIPSPNSPTGNPFPVNQIEQICQEFKGIVLVDEAYADFANDNCLRLLKKYQNLILSRTMSKSYSMAGVRLGWAISSPEIIKAMIKVKDSYNVNTLSQKLATAALKDQKYFKETMEKIKETRNHLSLELIALGFKVIPSQANFILTSPPDKNGEALFKFLRQRNVLVRHFSGERTKRYIRITIGRREDMELLISLCREYTSKH